MTTTIKFKNLPHRKIMDSGIWATILIDWLDSYPNQAIRAQFPISVPVLPGVDLTIWQSLVQKVQNNGGTQAHIAITWKQNNRYEVEIQTGMNDTTLLFGSQDYVFNILFCLLDSSGQLTDRDGNNFVYSVNIKAAAGSRQQEQTLRYDKGAFERI